MSGHIAWHGAPSVQPRDPSTGIKDKPCGVVDGFNYGGDFDGDPGVRWLTAADLVTRAPGTRQLCSCEAEHKVGIVVGRGPAVA